MKNTRFLLGALVLALAVPAAVTAQGQYRPTALSSVNSAQLRPLLATDDLDSEDIGIDTSFIDVNGYKDLEFEKVFLFLGGSQTGTYSGALSLGTAFKLGGQYFGLYYSGDIVNASGETTNGGAEGEKDIYTEPVPGRNDNTGLNKFALLWGGPIGGLRLDFITYGDAFSTQKYDGDFTKIITAPATTTLTWGNTLGGVPINVSAGVLWPAVTKTAVRDGKCITESEGGAFSLRGELVPADTKAGGLQALGSELRLTFGFPHTVKNDFDSDAEESGRRSWAIEVNANYTIDVGTEKFNLSIKPNAYLAFWGLSGKSSVGSTAIDTGSIFGFELLPSVELLAEAGPFRNFSFYTGLTLNLLDFYTTSKAAGDDANKDTYNGWAIDGITLDSGRGSPSLLKVGTKWEPTPHIAIAADISTLLDQIITVDAETYEVSTASSGIWGDIGIVSPLDWLSGLHFNLTATVKF
ncbi:MAG: hypothetical protein LBR16_02065 [Treponema sp.]|jgi:hypothetical protein|nr:hypothetical protein [Treponema sp.]